MPAYVLVEVDVTDPVGYEEYKAAVPAIVRAFGGKFLVRGGAAEALEGGRAPKRLVVLEFPSMEQAKKWWASEQYAPVKAIRERCATTTMFLVEGA